MEAKIDEEYVLSIYNDDCFTGRSNNDGDDYDETISYSVDGSQILIKNTEEVVPVQPDPLDFATTMELKEKYKSVSGVLPNKSFERLESEEKDVESEDSQIYDTSTFGKVTSITIHIL